MLSLDKRIIYENHMIFWSIYCITKLWCCNFYTFIILRSVKQNIRNRSSGRLSPTADLAPTLPYKIYSLKFKAATIDYLKQHSVRDTTQKINIKWFQWWFHFFAWLWWVKLIARMNKCLIRMFSIYPTKIGNLCNMIKIR